MLLSCDLQNSCLRSLFDLTLETQTQNQNPHLHFSCSLLLKPILFTDVTSLQHTLSAYKLTCVFVLSDYIDSLIVVHTHFCHCHYVSCLTAVNCFMLSLQVSQQRPTMSCRCCSGCTFSQHMQLSVSCSLIKVLLNFLTSLSSVCSLHMPVYFLHFHLLMSLSS